MKLKIRSKLLIEFFFLVVLSSLIQAFGFEITRSYITVLTSNRHFEKSQVAVDKIRDFFNSIERLNQVISDVYRENPDAESPQLTEAGNFVLLSNEHIRSLIIHSLDGNEIIRFDGLESQNRQDTIRNLSEELETAQNGITAYSKVFFIDQEPLVEIYYPVFSNENEVMGIIQAEVSLEKLWNVISEVRLGENGFAYVVDHTGVLIAHPDHEYVDTRPNLSARPFVVPLLRNSLHIPKPEDYYYTNEKNISVVSRALRVPKVQWLVVFEQPVVEAYKFLAFIRTLFLATLAGSIILLLLISFLFSGNITAGILKLKEVTQELEKGFLKTRITLKSGDEIESLAQSFNAMAEKLLERESTLKKEKQKTETMLESLTDGVIALDDRLTIILYNRAAREITGFTPQEVLGRLIDTITFFDKDVPFSFVGYLKNANERGTIVNKELYFTSRESKKVFVAVSVAPVLFSETEEKGWIIAFHDVTKEKELENMKLDFVSLAAHELRTPLTAIRGYSQSLLEDLGETISADQRQSLNRLKVSSDNLANLIDNLLNVSRIERETFKIELAPLDLVSLIKDLVKDFQVQASSKQQSLTLDIMGEPLPLVMADKFRITQALNNLLTNAVIYTPPHGSIQVIVQKLSTQTTEQSGYLVVSIKDTGQGIPREALPRIFTKFFRVSGPLEEGSKGTGLGLYITKSIITLHKGEIWVESELNKGSTFTFTLPITTHAVAASEEQDPTNPPLFTTIKTGVMINNARLSHR
ncbi:PAS domain S-box protein [Candidatus Gottesmanbacteria bacterium]|nr:PAS domain S-box protein [Candidatus Gottesmanbacteria bacterium]